ncbi:MAG: glycosyltransferase 87 family protein [Gaiellales bacterium]
MAGVLFAGTLAVALGRILTSPLHVSLDDWTYTVWGQAIVDGHRPALHYLLTAPKPLAYLLAVLVEPLPPGRGFALAVAVFGALLVAAIAIAVHRGSGLLGVPVAIGLLVASEGFRYNVQRGSIDLVTAALVVLALVVRGRVGIGLLVCAGLVRPEVWPIVPLLAYLELSGTRWRRLIEAAGAALVAPALWALTDIAANGRPFVFLVVGKRDQSFAGSASQHPLSTGLTKFWDALTGEVGRAAILLGVAGLVLHLVRSYRSGRFDPLPAATAVILSVGVTAELWQGLPRYPRYTTSIAALLLVGSGWLVGDLLRQVRGRMAMWAAAAASLAMIAGALLLAPVSYPDPIPTNMGAALPVIERALRCGPVGVSGYPHRRNPIMSRLAALGHLPLTSFYPVRPHGTISHGALLRPLGGWHRFPPGRVIRTSAGNLWFSPDCAAKAGVTSAG